jgi:FkbM family methyltransferase
MNPATQIRFAIQRVMRSAGYEIRRFTLDDMNRLKLHLELHEVDTVLDVGANIGQFASTLRATGYSGTIISFEPQSQAHGHLEKLAESDPQWIVAPRAAVGAEAGEIVMNLSANSVSSSALPILDTHTESAKGSSYVGQEVAPVIRLDDCDLVPAEARLFIKIDTQGFESEVIKGAPNMIARALGIQTELSLAKLYEGQADYLELLGLFTKLGFEPWSIEPGFEDQRTRRLLQMDATFFRPAHDQGQAN